MRKKINVELMLIAAVAIILTGIFATFAYYRIFREEIFQNLKTCACVLAENISEDLPDPGNYGLADETLRITRIADDGTVLQDSSAKTKAMENHGNRPEIREALETGQGTAARRSKTLGKSTFYYALRLNDGSVLRVAKESGNIFGMFLNGVPAMVLALVLLFAFCALLAHFLTRSFIKPIEKAARNLEDHVDVGAYQELEPFLETIRAQHQDIMENAKMRQDFTANVTHELKTPLTAVSGYAQLIESGMTGEEDTRRFAGEIHRNAKRLLLLINDILQLSELDSMEGVKETERLNLYEMAENCMEILQINGTALGVTLSITGEPAQITGNRGMIEEVLYNLCDNAIRYNKQNGRVEIHVEDTPEGAVLTVADTGIGIPKNHQERIFERFYRVDKSRSKERGGTGLGLAIVKHIVSEHHAKMFLESEVGKGTTITVLFPNQSAKEIDRKL